MAPAAAAVFRDAVAAAAGVAAEHADDVDARARFPTRPSTRCATRAHWARAWGPPTVAPTWGSPTSARLAVCWPARAPPRG